MGDDTEVLTSRVLCLPSGTAIGPGEIDGVAAHPEARAVPGGRASRAPAPAARVTPTSSTGPVERRLREILREQLGALLDVDTLDPDTPLRGQGLGLDSLDMVALIVQVEEEFGISFAEEEIAASVETVRALVAAVERKWRAGS